MNRNYELNHLYKSQTHFYYFFFTFSSNWEGSFGSTTWTVCYFLTCYSFSFLFPIHHHLLLLAQHSCLVFIIIIVLFLLLFIIVQELKKRISIKQNIANENKQCANSFVLLSSIRADCNLRYSCRQRETNRDCLPLSTGFLLVEDCGNFLCHGALL